MAPPFGSVSRVSGISSTVSILRSPRQIEAAHARGTGLEKSVTLGF